MHILRKHQVLMLASLFALSSCDRAVEPPVTGELSLSVVSGDQQEGSAGQELANPLVVKVTKTDGGPVKGQVLNFHVVAGGGSVFAGTAITDQRGIAQERWTLGSEGPQSVEVRAVDNETGEPLVFATFRASIRGCDCWMTKASMSVARSSAASGVIDRKLYVVGGVRDGAYNLSLERYDPATDTWTITGDALAVGRSGMAGAALNGLLYIVDGFSPGVGIVQRLEAFDPATGHWTRYADPPTARSALGAATINGVLYAVGGITNNGFSNVLEAYNPSTNTWTTKSSMPTPRYGPAVVALNGILYAIGGGDANGPVTVVEAYDPTTDTWTTKASLPSARAFSIADVSKGVVYVAGGYDGSFEPQGVMYAYDPATDSWTAKSAMPTPRHSVTGNFVDALFYVAGGSALGYQSIVEAYRP